MLFNGGVELLAANLCTIFNELQSGETLSDD